MADHVYRVTEVVGTSSDSLEGAIRTGIDKAAETIRGLDWFEVTEIRGHLEEGSIAALPGGDEAGVPRRRLAGSAPS